MKKIVVTGGSGKAGRAVVRDLLEHGYDVLNIDLVPPREPLTRFLRVDLTEQGQAFEALAGADAVVHLAAIPAPGLATDEVTFRVNTTSTYNVFAAAIALRLRRVVWASSETTLGLPYDRQQPHYAPIDEEAPLYPESTYALSKLVGEDMAKQFSRWSGIPFIALRFSNIMERADYERFPTYWDDPRIRKWNLWGYVDEGHVAQSCRLAVESALPGAESFIIAAADTCMKRSNTELMAEVFPTVPLRPGHEQHQTLLSIDKARRLLGYNPTFTWRELF